MIVDVRRDVNRGIAVAPNDGIERSRGRFVSFVVTVDEFEPTLLERTYERLAEAAGEAAFAWTCSTMYLTESSGTPSRKGPAQVPKRRTRLLRASAGM